MCCGDWSELWSAARRRLLRGAGTCRLLALIIGLSGSLSLTVCAQVPEPVELPTAQPLGVPEIETPATDPQPEIPAADSATEAPADPLSPAAQQKWLDQLQRFDPALAQQKLTAGQVPQDPQQQRVQFFIETPHLGQVYVSGPSARPYFAAKLTVLNLTPDPVVIKREQVTFTINGQKLELKEVPPDIKFYGVEIDQQHYQLGQLNPFLTVQIPPGGIRSDWIFATQFPTQGAIPKIEVQIQQGETPVKLDVNQLQRSLLSLETAQLGPRNCLTVLRISGELNIINLGGMIDELDRLATQKQSRAIVSFTSTAKPLPEDVQVWLRRQALTRGTDSSEGEGYFPVFPGGLSEFHLAALPRATSQSDDEWDEYGEYDLEPSPVPVIHATELQAVIAALRTACRALPRAELVTAMQQGPTAARAAAMIWGAARLAPEQVPLLLKFVDDPDVILQQAALAGLGDLGDRAAIAKLVEVAQQTREPHASTAITALAGSRFPQAHQALLQVLKQEAPQTRQRIVVVLAQFPRPLWGEVLVDFSQAGEVGLRSASLKALNQLGHPRLLEILISTLHAPETELAQLAFEILAVRPEPAAQQSATDFALSHLEHSQTDPEPIYLRFLMRIKDQRALPFLLRRLPVSDSKEQLLEAVGQIGDQRIIEPLLALYDQLPESGQAGVLNLLNQWNSPKYAELARPALLSKDPQVVYAASHGFVQIADEAAVQTLVKALQQNQEPNAWQILCNALGMIGTRSARDGLMQVRDHSDRAKVQLVVNALTMIRQRSPAFQFVTRAQALIRQQNWKDALKDLNFATEQDPELPEAFVARAHVYVRLNKFPEASKDYARGYELDSYNAQALTGVCIGMVVAGQIEEGLKKLEQERDKFKTDGLFLYNAACAYGRALQALEQQPDFPNREALQKQYTVQALRDLRIAIARGFRDIKWMQEDPDLKALFNNADFKTLVATDPDQIEQEEAPHLEPAQESLVPLE